MAEMDLTDDMDQGTEPEHTSKRRRLSDAPNETDTDEIETLNIEDLITFPAGEDESDDESKCVCFGTVTELFINHTPISDCRRSVAFQPHTNIEVQINFLRRFRFD